MNRLRQYESWELGSDGYPFAWHGRCTCDQVSVMDSLDMCFYDECTGTGPSIKDMVREEAQNRCERCWHPYVKGMGEWSPCDERCTHGGPFRARSAEPGPNAGVLFDYPTTASIRELVATMPFIESIEARYRILTVHHLDEDKANCRWWNLVALCQRCHLSMQKRVVMDRPYHYEHSEWFQPYAAGFYAFKYLGEDLSREEVMARLPELLKLEHRFTQGVLL